MAISICAHCRRPRGGKSRLFEEGPLVSTQSGAEIGFGARPPWRFVPSAPPSVPQSHTFPPVVPTPHGSSTHPHQQACGLPSHLSLTSSRPHP